MLNLLRKSFNKKLINKYKIKSIYYAYITSGFIFLNPPKNLNNKRFRLNFV